MLRWTLPVFTPDDVLDPVVLKADGVAPWAAQAVALEWVGMTDFRPMMSVQAAAT